MLSIEKTTYSIFDVYVLMQDDNDYFICTDDYQFKNLSIFNSIIYGQLYIDNRIIPFMIDSTAIIHSDNDSSDSIIIDKYVFTML